MVVGEAVREAEEHRKDVLHDRRRAVVAQVADCDAVLTRGGDIHVVDAGRGQRDEPKLRICRDGRAIDHGLVGEYRLEPRDPRWHIGLRSLAVNHDAGHDAFERARVEITVADRAEVEKHRAHGTFSRGNS